MTGPLAEAIEHKGGTVQTGTEVTRLLYEAGRVTGAESSDRTYRSSHVVLATSLVLAQRLLREHFAGHEWFEPLLRMPSMPSVTLQAELDEPSMEVDRTAFGPGTAWGSFAEQSRTTFRHAPGRLSIILAPPERYLHLPPEEVFQIVCQDGQRLGFDLGGHCTAYRVVSLPHDFYSLEPGNDWMRPSQRTPVAGLTLAGDYTRQRFLASREGAVVSGQKAAGIVIGSRND